MDLDDLRHTFLCAICKDIYKSPKRLPTCGHTFCEDCIRGYLLQEIHVNGQFIYDFENGKNPDFKPEKQNFLCPYEHCKSENKTYDCTKNVTQWVYQCYNDLQLQTVVDLGLNDGPPRAWQCQQCAGASLSATATHVCLNHMRLYCSACGFIHKSIFKKNKYCQSRTFDLSDVEGFLMRESRQESENDRGLNKARARPVFCRVHRLWKIEHFCSNCNVDCCAKCIENHHTKCKSHIKHANLDVDLGNLKVRLRASLKDLDALHTGHLRQIKRVNELYPDSLYQFEDSSDPSSPRSSGDNESPDNSEEGRADKDKTSPPEFDNKVAQAEVCTEKSKMPGTAASNCPPYCKCEVCVATAEMDVLKSKLKLGVARSKFLKTHVEKMLEDLENLPMVTNEIVYRMTRNIAEVENEVFHKMKTQENEKKMAEQTDRYGKANDTLH